MDPNKHMTERSGSAVLAYALAGLLIVAVIIGVVLLIVNNPKETLIVILAIIGGIVAIAIVIILLQVFVGIYYGFKGSETQTDMAYDLNDQEHAESFSEAKEVPPSRK